MACSISQITLVWLQVQMARLALKSILGVEHLANGSRRVSTCMHSVTGGLDALDGLLGKGTVYFIRRRQLQ